MTRTKWVASGALGALTAGVLIFIGVQPPASSASGPADVQQVAATRSSVAAEASRSAAAVVASERAESVMAAAETAASEKAAATAAQQEAAAAVAGKRTELEVKATVDAYFEAINAGDYRTAYELGGHHFNSSYDSFRAGFDNTARDEWEVTGVSGKRVYVTLTAHNLDCTTQVWRGYYVVSEGELTDAQLKGGEFRDCF